MIDLHLHTTASDGTLTPVALVSRAAAAGLTVISVTDHDTTAGTTEARRAAAQRGLALVSGIEITAVENGRDVHVLGYFIDERSAGLARFLEAQRGDRIRRVREMVERLADLGAPVDLEALLTSDLSGRSIGRPALADALAAAGHAVDRNDAFDRYLGTGCPAFVPRQGLGVGDVITIVHEAGGIASLAHPALSHVDELIPSFAQHGLDAIEARHSEHPPDVETHYRALAARLGLAVSGGSDFHGDVAHRHGALGSITLSALDFSLLQASAMTRK